MSRPHTGATGSIDDQQIINTTTPDSGSERDEKRAAANYAKGAHGHLKMKVRVYSPFRDYYDGVAFSLTATSATGPFDILPKHHNFISLLEPCELIIRTIDEGEHRIRISGGLIHVKADEVVVFLDV